MEATAVLWLSLTHALTVLVFLMWELAGKPFHSHRQPSAREEAAGTAGHKISPVAGVRQVRLLFTPLPGCMVLGEYSGGAALMKEDAVCL